MLKLPEILLKKYNSLLIKNNILSHAHGNYKKWLQYYLDFCKKYKHPYAAPESLLFLLINLRKKSKSVPSNLKQARLWRYTIQGSVQNCH
ncbi:MAG: hypothetical protein KKE12_11410 [Proteobacteria bacterium]|nr:hypothetical protein [Pseudomonadota bacterium]